MKLIADTSLLVSEESMQSIGAYGALVGMMSYLLTSYRVIKGNLGKV